MTKSSAGWCLGKRCEGQRAADVGSHAEEYNVLDDMRFLYIYYADRYELKQLSRISNRCRYRRGACSVKIDVHDISLHVTCQDLRDLRRHYLNFTTM